MIVNFRTICTMKCIILVLICIMGHATFCKSIQNVTYINEGTLESRIERIERFIEALEDKRE